MSPPALRTLLAGAVVAFATAAAQAPLFEVPQPYVEVSGDAVTFDTGTFQDTYVAGLGWLSGSAAEPPVVQGGEVLVGPELLARLALPDHAAPRSAAAPVPAAAGAVAVRFGGSSQVRIVLDLPLPDAAAIQGLQGQGRLEEGEALSLSLPELPLPLEQPDPYHGVDVTLLSLPGATRLEVRGPAMLYEVFALEAPTRLVIDVVPLQSERVETETRLLREGVTYRRFGAPTPAGSSRVHLLEIAPGSGEFRVVGTSEVPRTLSELADGAFAAINAGYFDTANFAAIGLLRIDYGLLSLPSRNRASIGFGSSGPVMERVEALLEVRVNGRPATRGPMLAAGGMQLYTSGGALVGAPSQGVIAVSDGRAVLNRVGPVLVPEGGFALAYPADNRDLALVDPGDRVEFSVDFEPDDFDRVRYAVEAGPMLVAHGRPAFDPDSESFKRGERILDAYTQQSAIGVRADGTVLLLVAENMRAEDLVPLFLSLDARHAMRLDSGSSSTLLADGRVLNRERERRIVSAIVFLPGDG